MPTRYPLWLPCCLLALLWASASGWVNAQVVRIDPAFQSSPLGPYLRYIEDTGDTLTFDDIRRLPDSAWTHNHDDALKRGYSKTPLWIRIDIFAAETLIPNTDFILDMDLSFFGFLDYYVVTHGPQTRGRVDHHETGLARPYSQRPIPLETFALPLRFNPGEHKTVYVRAFSEGAMLLPFTLYAYDAFHQHRTLTSMMLGSFFSLCLVLSAYNLFLYLTVREPSYLFYTINMLTLLWLQLSLRGYSVHYLWHDHFPGFTYIEPTMMVWLGLVFTLLFSSSFLKLRQWHPRLRFYFMALITVSSMMTTFTFFIPLHISLQIFNVVSLIVILSVIGSAVYTLLQGNKAARFFLLGWAFFLFTAMVTGIYLQGYLPTNLLTRHGMLIGGAMEGILLSLALADRINFMQKQKLQAQQDAVAALENAHRLKDDFLLKITRELHQPLDEIGVAITRNRDATDIDVIAANNLTVESQVHRVLHAVDQLLREAETNAGLTREHAASDTIALAPAPAPAPEATPAPKEPIDHPPLALIVEDNLVNQKVLQKMLERCGCRVHISQHGAEALEFVETHTPDIVFMDCQMPVMDGFEATRQLRQRLGAKTLPIVAVTANVLSNDRLRCLESGMNDYLPKPVKIEQIQTALNRWLPTGASHAA